MNPLPSLEKEDPNTPQTQAQSTKVRNIILVNNSSPGSILPSQDPDSLWPGGLFPGSKMTANGAAFLAEAFQKQGISNQYNFNAGSRILMVFGGVYNDFF